MLKIHVLTLFPEMFAPLQCSISDRAQKNNVYALNLVQIRDFAINKHGQVDDSPYGGEAGMVMRPEPLASAIKSLARADGSLPKVYYMSALGTRFDHKKAIEMSEEEEFVMICGHYKGIDQRIIDKYVDEELSLGDFVLTGGELAAMTMVDATFRLIPGAMGDRESAEEDSFYDGLLGHSVYTRPAEFEGMKVPDVLLSGHHAKAEEWRKEDSYRLTREKRPDLAHIIPPPPEPTQKRKRRKKSPNPQ